MRRLSRRCSHLSFSASTPRGSLIPPQIVWTHVSVETRRFSRRFSAVAQPFWDAFPRPSLQSMVARRDDFHPSDCDPLKTDVRFPPAGALATSRAIVITASAHFPALDEA
jgi:hypothetical protein